MMSMFEENFVQGTEGKKCARSQKGELKLKFFVAFKSDVTSNDYTINVIVLFFPNCFYNENRHYSTKQSVSHYLQEI